MAITLIAAAGATDANSYCTVADGNLYHTMRLFGAVWISANETTKTASLVWATSMLDNQVDWMGTKVTESQSLRWPRTGVIDRDGHSINQRTIPISLANATAELARLLISEDRNAEQDGIGFEEIEVGPINLIFDKSDKKTVIPDGVFNLINFLGKRKGTGNTMRLVRV